MEADGGLAGSCCHGIACALESCEPPPFLKGEEEGEEEKITFWKNSLAGECERTASGG